MCCSDYEVKKATCLVTSSVFFSGSLIHPLSAQICFGALLMDFLAITFLISF